jgi:hypothetical protein
MLNQVLEKGLANRARSFLGDGAQSLFQFLGAAEIGSLHRTHGVPLPDKKSPQRHKGHKEKTG